MNAKSRNRTGDRPAMRTGDRPAMGTGDRPAMGRGDRPVAPTRLVFPTLETDAERAWRYGESAFRFRRANGVTWFGDGSCLTRWSVDTPRGVRHTLDQVRVRTGMNLDAVDWSAA